MAGKVVGFGFEIISKLDSYLLMTVLHFVYIRNILYAVCMLQSFGVPNVKHYYSTATKLERRNFSIKVNKFNRFTYRDQPLLITS